MDLRILGSGLRTTIVEPDNILSLQRQPVLTNLVLTSGIERAAKTYGPNAAPTPGYALFPETPVERYKFSYAKADGSESIPTDSVRGLKDEIRYVGQGQTEVQDQLVRYTLAGLVDDDEQANAVNPWNPAIRAANLARSQLQLDLELKKATLATTSGNFLATITVSSGAGWQTAGGNKMLSDITVAAKALEAALGVSASDLYLALFGDARWAAKQSVELLARTPFALGARTPTLDDVAQYLRIGGVWEANPLYIPARGATPLQIYGNDAILYYPGDPALLRSGIGGRIWGQTFSLGPGAALTPYYVSNRTSWAYPWQKREASRVLDTSAAYRIVNPYGT